MGSKAVVSTIFELNGFDIAQMLAALGDPVRFEIFQALRASFGLRVGQLGVGGLSAPTMSHHLNKMVRAGLLCRESSGRHRIYSINTKAMAALGTWYLDSTDILGDRLYNHVRNLSSRFDDALTS